MHYANAVCIKRKWNLKVLFSGSQDVKILQELLKEHSSAVSYRNAISSFHANYHQALNKQTSNEERVLPSHWRSYWSAPLNPELEAPVPTRDPRQIKIILRWYSSEIRLTVSEHGKKLMMNMHDEQLAFPCHFPVLVQISSMTWATTATWLWQ